MATLRYPGSKCQIRIGTSSVNVATSPVLDNVADFSLTRNQDVAMESDGIGALTRTAVRGQYHYTGVINRQYNLTAFASTSTPTDWFSKWSGAFVTTTQTDVFIQVKTIKEDGVAGKTYLIGPAALGNYDMRIPVGGPVTESIPFQASVVTET